ncbi:restriction endonuclease [Teredinibacter turnerae]|uniref:restriction endonuclease n=1 Tax=Teredinibacter turnerae TaxID=2426 RepID=UPI0005F863C5|nr:restriction endonuclease [Teredinibacter turnerae]
MLKEIIIWPTEENKGHERGVFFEKLANRIFSTQRYKVSGNVHVTGQEFDLECEHIDRENERCLVECKAKQSLSCDEIKKFVFSVGFNNFDYGYFLYTRSFERQVAGLISELKGDERYRNLYFWSADKVIELLVASGTISSFDNSSEELEVHKVILLYSFKGIFYVSITGGGTIPEYFTVYHANDLSLIKEDDLISEIRAYIDELSGLENFIPEIEGSFEKEPQREELDTVTQIQSSDSWDDYKPASLKYFVGRKRQKDKIFGFLNAARSNELSKRVFYIDGKSGWGKSSLMSDLRERCRNRHYKNKFLSVVIDSRSANSNNFLPLCYELLINKAVETGFIPKKFLSIKIPSSYDILSHDISKDLLSWLEMESKILVLVFDQFEDIFRKEGIFKSFYKFFLDVNNIKGDIVLGFSWKSEVNIPIENEAYHLWQQSRDLAFRITLDEFDASESKAIVRQLEKDVSARFDIDFTRKVVDNAQGYPWLVKKLCIHIKKQVNRGLSIEELYDQDFQVEDLFKSDLEELESKEVKSLRYIAKRAFNDQALDVTELDEVVPSDTVQSLIHKRYVIKSGTKYNIYWDIFRDYLVLDQIPPIGETYLIRQPINPVLEAFLTFKFSGTLNVNDFIALTPSSVGEGAALNILRELRNIGLVNYRSGDFTINVENDDVGEEYFKDYLNEKLGKHTFTIEMRKIEGRQIAISDLTGIIKEKIKTKTFATKTLETYAQIFLGWLDFAEINIPNLSKVVVRRAKNALSYTPQMNPTDVEAFLREVTTDQELVKTKREEKLLYDARSMGIVGFSKETISLTHDGEEIHAADIKRSRYLIAQRALKMEKIRIAYEALAANPDCKSREFKSLISSVLDGLNSKVYINKTSRTLFLWAHFIMEAEKEYNNAMHATGA